MEKKWMFRPIADETIVDKLTSDLGIDPVLARLLAQRGIASFDEAKLFFRPKLEHLHSPFLMADLEKACLRILSALDKGEKIMVYGDYDVDGTTSVALMYSFLKEHKGHLIYYIPDRYAEGYGISVKGIETAKEQNVSLIIALDCGIKAHNEVDLANKKGIDVIICDHHLPEETLPNAFAVLDPKREDCDYPFKELSGCGVGFKVLQGLCLKMDLAFDCLLPYLDLVAVSIASDIVPILGENRVLAFFGMQLINEAPRKSIHSLLTSAKKHKRIGITDLVFQVGPRINAAGRLELGTSAVELLLAEDDGLISLLTEKINAFNEERKKLDKEITQDALAMIAESKRLVKAHSTVLYNPEWHKGVIGIVASRVTETYFRPTVLLTESNGVITGSARSVADFDIHGAIKACEDLLLNWGGHHFAAGVNMLPKNLDAFKKRFEEVVKERLKSHDLRPQLKIDTTVDLAAVTPKFYRILQQLAPFGPGNMRPVFAAEHLQDTGYAKIVGENHLKLTAQQFQRPPRIGAIAFQQANKHRPLMSNKPLDMAFTVEENEWNGKVNLQLNVKDIRENAPLVNEQ